MNDPFEIEEMLIRAATEFSDAEERARFLDWACRGDDGLRVRMEKLLSIQGSSDRFFDFKPFEITDEKSDDLAADAADEGGGGEIGLRIGRYRLIRRLGEGGCGVVYQAEQEQPVRRHVALKLIRVGLDHAQVIERFEMERQALAMMDHPGIARVLDAGATPTGRPFFVMQWVTGEPITGFCEKNRLSIRQRLELFIRVCHAIQHAHQKGVIHRDIKPSNVLASFHDGVPLPKVIDFGIAMATGGGLTEPDGEQEPILGTPNYMSPEQGQRGGIDVDTRTDIFSLGVLLCEILVGQTPFGPVEPGVLHTCELPDAIANRQPKAPSEILSECPLAELAALAAARSCKPRDLIRLVRGDLDAIVMKCLQTKRQHRYDTASGLATDIQRHLEDRLVTARTAGRRDQLAKLMRRNRLAFAVGGVAFFTLAAGFGSSTWLFLRENQARREQSRLRHEAEAARTVETRLRGQAEAREACAQAAVKLSYGQIEEADQLLAAIPTDMAPSSLEAADVYREVGEWHRQAGRIQQAAERFTALAGSISAVDRSDIHRISGDLLPAAVATCEVGDWPRYEQVRRVALERFGTTHNPVVAEQIIKACTLRPADPADPATMAKIATLGAFLESAIGPEGMNEGGGDSAAWKCYSLALWHHRRGDPAQTIRWGEWSLQRSMESEPRVVCVRLLLAMARHRLGETEEARKLLADAAKPTRALMESTSGKWSDDRSLWVDWTNAHILLKEAEAVIGAFDTN